MSRTNRAQLPSAFLNPPVRAAVRSTPTCSAYAHAASALTSQHPHCNVHKALPLNPHQLRRAFGGVPRAIVPDNLKAGVSGPCYDEPTIHPTYQDLARHYDTVILPARAKHPRDKASQDAVAHCGAKRSREARRKTARGSDGDNGRDAW